MALFSLSGLLETGLWIVRLPSSAAILTAIDAKVAGSYVLFSLKWMKGFDRASDDFSASLRLEVTISFPSIVETSACFGFRETSSGGGGNSSSSSDVDDALN